MEITAIKDVSATLSLLLPDGDTGKFPRASIYDSAGSLVTTVDLTHTAQGLYMASYTFTSFGDFDVVYITYRDAARTMISTKHGRALDRFRVQLTVEDEVWDTVLAGHLTVGSTGKALDDAGATASIPAIVAGVWGEALPGSFVAGSAGERLASTDDNVDVAVSTRAEPGDEMDLEAGTIAEVADAVWDEPAAAHTAAGSMGFLQNNVASTVLDELLAGHFVADSVGEALQLIRGLVQQNYFVDNTLFNGAGLMVSARFRLFASKAATDAATIDAPSSEGAIATYRVTATSEVATSSQLRSYKVTRES